VRESVILPLHEHSLVDSSGLFIAEKIGPRLTIRRKARDQDSLTFWWARMHALEYRSDRVTLFVSMEAVMTPLRWGDILALMSSEFFPCI
jgi:hypothetical protein